MTTNERKKAANEKKWFEFDQRTLERFSPVCFPYLPIYSSPLQLPFLQSLEFNFEAPNFFGPRAVIFGTSKNVKEVRGALIRGARVRGALIF